jgi:hypothetical protein
MRPLFGCISFIGTIICFILFAISLGKGHSDLSLCYLFACYACAILIAAFEDGNSIYSSLFLGLFSVLCAVVSIGFWKNLADPIEKDCHTLCRHHNESCIHEVYDTDAHCSPLTNKYYFRTVLVGNTREETFSRYSRCGQCGRLYINHYRHIYTTEEWLAKIKHDQAIAESMSYPDP